MPYKVVMARILQETEELEALLAAVSIAKGYHEYEAMLSWS